MEKKYVYNEERSILVKNDFFSVQKNNILHGLELCFKKAISQNLLEQVIHAGFLSMYAKTFDLDTNKQDHYARTLSQNDYTITR